MKQLEITTNKRLLIVETEADYFGYKDYRLKFICKGPELTEDTAKGLVDLHETGYYKDYLNDNNFFTLPSKSFISAIESKGYHWGDNPVKYPDKNNPKYYDEPFDGNGFYQEIYSSDIVDWKKTESRTFNPEKCIICEIL